MVASFLSTIVALPLYFGGPSADNYVEPVINFPQRQEPQPIQREKEFIIIRDLPLVSARDNKRPHYKQLPELPNNGKNQQGRCYLGDNYLSRRILGK